jgi:hypothetical protein
MRKNQWPQFVVLFLGLAACASPLADYSGYVEPRPYAIDCDSSWRYAATALKANGFVIADVQRGPRGGVVIGKRAGETMTMGLSCEADGVHVSPSGLTPYARNGMRIAFERVMAAAPVQPPQGLEVKAELIVGPESALYFSRRLDDSTVATLFRIANGGERPMRLIAEKIRLRASSSGATAAPLDRQEIPPRLPELAAEMIPRLLASTVLERGGRAEGFLVFPGGRYDGALVPLVDVQTQEVEDFEISFPAAENATTGG